MSEQREWTQAWLDSQRQYWDAWFDWSRQAAGAVANESFKPEFGAGMSSWFQQATSDLPDQVRETYQHAFESGRTFYEMGETFWHIVRDLKEAGDEWRNALQENMDEVKEAMQQTATDTRDAWAGFADVWGLRGNAWQDFMRSLGESPVHAEGIAGVNAGEAWNRILQAPAIGYNREWQEKAQKWGMFAADYFRAMQEYAAYLNDANLKAIDMMTHRLIDLAQKGESPDSIRAVYDLWVDCGEAAYGEMGESDEYLKAQGMLMNALMRMKNLEHEMGQDILSTLNVPSRRELDTALLRQHEIRRELNTIRDMVEDEDVSELRKEISSLKRDVRELKKHLNGNASGAAATSSSSAGKRTTKKSTVKKTAAKKTAAKKKAAPRRKASANKSS